MRAHPLQMAELKEGLSVQRVSRCGDPEFCSIHESALDHLTFRPRGQGSNAEAWGGGAARTPSLAPRE